MNWTKQNGIKILIGTVILIGFFAWSMGHFRGDAISSPATTPSDDLARSSAELCKEGAFTSPSVEEVNYNKAVTEDKFVQYLKTAINNWLSGKYGSTAHPKTSYECPYTGLMDGRQCPDGAFDEGDYDNGLSKINQDYLKSKFVVLQTDQAPVGGYSIILMFKDVPDKVFYAWVYGYRDDNDKIVGFDLRALNEHDLSGDEAPSIVKIQKMFINELCNDSLGI